MKFRPLHDRVLIKVLDSEEKTAGGIIIPDTAKEKPQEGEVVAVGPGAKNEDGKLTKMDVKVGDIVLFGKWSGTEVKIDGKEYSIMILYSLPSIFTSVPDHLPKRTISPTLTSILVSLPSSFFAPGPTATTSPSCGFSFAVSGIIIPPAVFSSLSKTLISTRSCKGLNFIHILL